MAPVKYNIFSDVPERLLKELVSTLAENEQFRLERIVSKGHASASGDWYDQPWDEWVLLLRGQAILRFAESNFSVTMNPGDYLQIPARVKHRVEWTAADRETFWLAVHFKTSEQ